jgi:hypothetical protein
MRHDGVSRIETAIVLGLAGIAIAGAGYGAFVLTRVTASADAPQQISARPQPTITPSAAASSAPHIDTTEATRDYLRSLIARPLAPAPAPTPFVATPTNDWEWQPNVLPVGWPQFTKLPDEKPLPSRSTKFKIDNANAVFAKWEAYRAHKAPSAPSNAEADLADRYLLSIARDDPAFPAAWAAFIKLHRALRDIALVHEVEEQKREARHRGVNVGMTEEQVLGSNWGRPMSRNTTITALGRHEQWVYGGNNYLYFENGVLTSIQTGR